MYVTFTKSTTEIDTFLYFLWQKALLVKSKMSDFSAMGAGVIADCVDNALCTFTCEDGSEPNVAGAECIVKKGKANWDLGGKKAPKSVECGGAVASLATDSKGSVPSINRLNESIA